MSFELDPRLISLTARRLAHRIGERFPDSGLSRISLEVCTLSANAEERLQKLRRTDWRARALLALGLIVIVSIAAATLTIAARGLTLADSVGALDVLQGIDAAINDLIFLALGVFFLFTIEARLKRRVALRALDELRSIAHVIDMHQLTKDPEHVIQAASVTASSPERTLSCAELTRYLDYCSELLSLTSKLAALHGQSANDPVVLDSVNGIQALTVGLSAKIWQKIMILDSIVVPRGEPEGLFANREQVALAPDVDAPVRDGERSVNRLTD
jgi:hypothetical protein